MVRAFGPHCRHAVRARAARGRPPARGGPAAAAPRLRSAEVRAWVEQPAVRDAVDAALASVRGRSAALARAAVEAQCACERELGRALAEAPHAVLLALDAGLVRAKGLGRLPRPLKRALAARAPSPKGAWV